MNPPSQQVIRILSSALSELDDANHVQLRNRINDEQAFLNFESEMAKTKVAWEWLNEMMAATTKKESDEDEEEFYGKQYYNGGGSGRRCEDAPCCGCCGGPDSYTPDYD